MRAVQAKVVRKERYFGTIIICMVLKSMGLNESMKEGV